jgi:hypothetical protein
MQITLFILLISTTLSFAQGIKQESFETLLAKGKAEFKKDAEQQDFKSAVSHLQKAVTLQPENAEAHYFLGFAYSKLNSKEMISMNLELLKRCSDEFEQVIQLTPHYTGEMLSVDPYAMISTEWGSMAMSYLYHDKLDSAVWAFNEGKRRGGFGEFYLSSNRKVLDLCSKHAILMTSGDGPTIAIWYLQTVENYRKDVALVNVNLLSTVWYPQMLRSKSIVSFDQSKAVVDTMQAIPFNDSIVSVRDKYAYKDFSWTVKKPIENKYLTRNERLFLSILKANEFESDVYMTTRFDSTYQLSLQDHSLHLILVDRINTNGKEKPSFASYKSEMTKILELTKDINKNSSDERNGLEWMRYDLLLHLEEEHGMHHKTEVKQVLKLLDTYIPEKNYPYSSKELKNYVDYIRKQY